MNTSIPENTEIAGRTLKIRALRFFIHIKNKELFSGAGKIAVLRFFIHTKNKEFLYIQKIREAGKKRFEKFLQIEYDYLKYLYSTFLKKLLRIYSSGNIPSKLLFKFYDWCVSTVRFENELRGVF